MTNCDNSNQSPNFIENLNIVEIVELHEKIQESSLLLEMMNAFHEQLLKMSDNDDIDDFYEKIHSHSTYLKIAFSALCGGMDIPLSQLSDKLYKEIITPCRFFIAMLEKQETNPTLH